MSADSSQVYEEGYSDLAVWISLELENRSDLESLRASIGLTARRSVPATSPACLLRAVVFSNQENVV
jgi:hypothetical protein